MKRSNFKFLFSVIGGILLIALGVLFLLNNFGILGFDWELYIGPSFAIIGIVFLLVFLTNTDAWWALIPGFGLIGIGTIVFMGQSFSTVAERWGGAIFLGLLGLAFVLIYITHTEHWWAIIPGGVLLALAGVTLVPDYDALAGGIFFTGLAVTFGLVYILPKPGGRSTWALYPAGILLLIGILVILGATNLINLVWPAVLLIAGGYTLLKALKKS